MGLINTNYAEDFELPSWLKFDFILLFLAVLLQQVHPVFVCVIFILMFICDSIRGVSYRILCFYNIFVFVIFAQFFYCGYTNGNMTFYNAIWYSVPSVIAVMLGHNYALKLNNPKLIIIFLFCISLFLALPHIIITVRDILSNGLINPDRSLSIDGYDETQRAITARTVELSLAICGIAAIFIKKLNAPLRISNLFIILSVLAELCTLHFVSRTGIAILIIALITGLLYKKIDAKQVIMLVMISFLVYKLFENSGFLDVFSERERDGSSIMDAGGRTERWAIGFAALLENPLGYNIEDWFAHNFWLDFGRVGGLIAFFLLCIFSILLFAKTIKLRSFQIIGGYNCLLIVVFSVTFLATLFTEPVHSGAPMYMYMYFLFAGFVDGLYNLNEL